MHTTQGQAWFNLILAQQKFSVGNIVLVCLFSIQALYSKVNFTLNQLSCIPLVVVLSCSFGGQKNEKPRHRVHQSHDALLMNCHAISFGHIMLSTSILTRIQPGRDNSLSTHKQQCDIASLKQIHASFRLYALILAVSHTVPEFFWNYFCYTTAKGNFLKIRHR